MQLYRLVFLHFVLLNKLDLKSRGGIFVSILVNRICSWLHYACKPLQLLRLTEWKRSVCDEGESWDSTVESRRHVCYFLYKVDNFAVKYR